MAPLLQINQPLNEKTASWPSDQPFEARFTARREEGSSVNLGAIRLSTHAGTHADAPLHFMDEGASIDQVPLTAYLGPATVIDATETGVINRAFLERAFLEKMAIDWTPRLLFHTRTETDYTTWNPDFPPFAPEAIAYMAERGVVLIGTDAPSVDPADSAELPAHHALARHGVVNLENLVLDTVEPGTYVLIALPLPLIGLDASPVRAVLLETKAAMQALFEA